ncbi:hypothetical protein Acr_00g0065890 [Actinidia rufa]|uniref:TF-B3 domain-containing protein n=1 Tax=Actinidia rufa TaxID=165716 RepID=A0A7J0DPY5_9ERIC|nr:hypothetical protein Acr_00g0065890 [Actinidia rufa]
MCNWSCILWKYLGMNWFSLQRIPEDFAKIYGNELSAFATLTVPSGRAWRVGVEKADTMIWLNDGWKEFTEHHSIFCGFFIVFNYEGN